MTMSRLFLLFCLCLLPAAVTRAQVNAALNKPVTTQYSTSTTSNTYPGDYAPGKITDGNLASFSHPDTMASTLGFRYDINLGRSYILDRLRIYNRNNCCPERLSNYRVSILADNGSGAPQTPAVWTAVVRSNGTNSGQGGFDEVLASANPGGTFTGQWVRIENVSGSAYNPQIAEVQALTYDVGNVPNVALGKPVTTSAAAWPSLPASNITDGSYTTLSHPQAAAGASLDYYYQIDFLQDYALDRVVLFSRNDGCCPERLTRYRVALFADNGGVPGVQTWSGDMRMDGSFPNSGETDVVRAENGTGDFHGRFLRIINLSNEAYNPQLAEVEAYRPPVPVINFFTTTAGNITATGNPALPLSATLSWKVTGATSLTLDQGIGSVAAPEGTRVVTPGALTTYKLTATNSTGTSTAVVTVAVDASQLPPRLNEFIAENDGALADEDGTNADWIELYNPNAFTVTLAGAHLTDISAQPQKWTFPAGVSIPPNGYLVVFASNKDRSVAGAPLHTNFQLSKTGEAIFLNAPGGTVTWSEIPSDYPATALYPVQYSDTSYGVNGSGQFRYFRPATPGAANAAAGFTAVVEDTSFSVKRGLYTSAQTLAITCATPGAEIRYTTNGAKPTATTGTVYTAPISLTTTTVIRAAAFLADAAPSNVDTHTYIFPGTVASQPTMQAVVTGNATWAPQIPSALADVPSISLTTPNPAAINNDAEVETAFEWIHPTDPLQHAKANCGVSWFGGAFTNFAKKSFRCYFRGVYGDKKLTANLFGGHEHGYHAVQEFDGIELRNGSHDMNARGFYMSNLFTDQVLNEQGNLAPHGRFVHLYINGTYWGLYHLRERWNAAMHSSYLGGTKDDYEAINGNYNVGGWATPGTPFDGDGAAWEYAKLRRTNYNELRSLIDVKNYVDFMITWMFGNSEDEWRGVSPNRLTGAGSGGRFILNDADGWLSVNGSNAIAAWDGSQDNTVRTSAWNGVTFTAGREDADGPGAIFMAMYHTAGSDYRMLLADRIHFALFNDGPLTVARNQARLDAMCLAIQRPFIAEAARWNYRLPADPPGGAENAGDWEDAWQVSRNSWMPTRTATVLTQFRTAGFYPALNAPTFTPNGGAFTAGATLTMAVASPPVGSVIYYTMDGTDPSLPGGAVSPGALTYTTPVPLLVNTVVRSRTYTPSTLTWSALQERFFQAPGTTPCPAGALVPSELHFNPTGDDDAEFIELLNVSNAAVNLRGCYFTQGVSFVFSPWRDTLLAPGQRIVLVDSEFAHRARYGWDREIGGIYFDNLSNGGETISFACGLETVFSCTFDGAWSPLADSGGYSLTLIRPQSGQNLSNAANWRPSTPLEGSPGSGDSGPAFSGSPTADGDLDGYSALIEYALGTSDSAPETAPVITFDPAAPGAFAYTAAATADDAILVAEVSTDMATWSSDVATVKPVSQQVLAGGKVRTVMAPSSAFLASASRYYVRLRVLPRP